MDNEMIDNFIQQGNIMQINNALVEDVFCSNNSSGFIVVSYSPTGRNNMNSTQNIQLNINDNTVIMNSLGQHVCPCCIQEDMIINAIISSRMTRSIPPQSNALLIIIQRRSRPQLPQTSTSIDRIAFVDTENNFLYTGNPNNINTQTRYVITDTTVIVNRLGNRIPLRALRPGQTVRIIHANFQTASIPPQTTAFRIEVL